MPLPANVYTSRARGSVIPVRADCRSQEQSAPPQLAPPMSFARPNRSTFSLANPPRVVYSKRRQHLPAASPISGGDVLPGTFDIALSLFLGCLTPVLARTRGNHKRQDSQYHVFQYARGLFPALATAYFSVFPVSLSLRSFRYPSPL
jgi:hypothetical protein